MMLYTSHVWTNYLTHVAHSRSGPWIIDFVIAPDVQPHLSNIGDKNIKKYIGIINYFVCFYFCFRNI